MEFIVWFAIWAKWTNNWIWVNKRTRRETRGSTWCVLHRGLQYEIWRLFYVLASSWQCLSLTLEVFLFTCTCLIKVCLWEIKSVKINQAAASAPWNLILKRLSKELLLSALGQLDWKDDSESARQKSLTTSYASGKNIGRGQGCSSWQLRGNCVKSVIRQSDSYHASQLVAQPDKILNNKSPKGIRRSAVPLPCYKW